MASLNRENGEVRRRDEQAATGALAGRVAESARLDALVDTVAGGGRAVLLLVGEAGIGKSALAAHALDAARPGMRTAVGYGVPLTIEQALAPWRAVLQSFGTTFDSH